jgi:hypothetical protein
MPDQARDVGIGDPRQALARRPAGRDGGQAPFDVAVVSSEMRRGQSIEQRAMRGIEIAQRDKMVREGPGLVPGPGVERGEQRRLVDQAGLQGEQAEEEVSVVGDGGHEESPFREATPDRAAHGGGAQAGGDRIARIIARGAVASIRRPGSDHPERSAPSRVDRPFLKPRSPPIVANRLLAFSRYQTDPEIERSRILSPRGAEQGQWNQACARRSDDTEAVWGVREEFHSVVGSGSLLQSSAD